MDENKPKNTSEFLEEQIKIRPRSRKRVMRRVTEVAALAVVFGLVACMTMLCLSPFLEEKLFPTPTNRVVFPEDNPSYTSEEIQPEDMLLEERATETNIIVEAPDIETQLLRTVYLLKEKAKKCNSWLVQVNGVTNAVSWLESTNVSSSAATGAIIADNGTELLILVENDCLQKADKINVTFSDGAIVEAHKKGEDLDAGLAVVAVAKETMETETLEACTVVEMASSSSKALPGSLVMALGNVNGAAQSTCYGLVTANTTEVNSWDGSYKLINTDIYGSKSPNGFLVNLRGQLIGVLCNDYNAKDVPNLTTALGINELKKKINRMSNGEAVALFGVKGTEVTDEAHEEYGVPYGAYVLGVKLDSPAMKAGIQVGDIITSINGREITSMSSLSYQLHQLDVGTEVEITAVRMSQALYRENTLKIVLENQK